MKDILAREAVLFRLRTYGYRRRDRRVRHYFAAERSKAPARELRKTKVALLEAMREHINDYCAVLASADGIETNWTSQHLKAEASLDAGFITIPHIRSHVAYAVALHEIGHIYGKHQRHPSTMVRERWAWKFARRHAMLWTEEMETQKVTSLKWYESQIRTGHVPALHPPTEISTRDK